MDVDFVVKFSNIVEEDAIASIRFRAEALDDLLRTVQLQVGEEEPTAIKLYFLYLLRDSARAYHSLCAGHFTVRTGLSRLGGFVVFARK